MEKLRLAEKKELDDIYNICLSIKEIYRVNKINLWNEYYPTLDIFVDDCNNNNLYVYTIDDKIVGSISIEDSLLEDGIKNEDTCYLCRLMVKPDLQGNGIGTKIISEMEKLLKSKGYKKFEFLVSNCNPQAIKLYLRLGCINLGYIKTPWEEEDDFYYHFRKNLE